MTYFFTPTHDGVDTIFGFAWGGVKLSSEVKHSTVRAGTARGKIALAPTVSSTTTRGGVAAGSVEIRTRMLSGLEYLPVVDGAAAGQAAVRGTSGGASTIRGGTVTASVGVRSTLGNLKIAARGVHPGPLASYPLGAWELPTVEQSVTAQVGVRATIRGERRSDRSGFAAGRITVDASGSGARVTETGQALGSYPLASV